MSAEGVEAIRKKFLHSSTSWKSISEALKLKEQGNFHFRKQDRAETQKALECYTKAKRKPSFLLHHHSCMSFQAQSLTSHLSYAVTLCYVAARDFSSEIIFHVHFSS